MKTKTLEAVIANIDTVTDFVNEELEAVECSMKEMMKIDVAIDEIVTNIASYAYVDGKGDMTVSFDFDEANRLVSLIFEDGGMAFNPLEKEDPDITLSAEERSIGGLGIFLVKKTMDNVLYERRDDKNILTVQKHIS